MLARARGLDLAQNVFQEGVWGAMWWVPLQNVYGLASSTAVMSACQYRVFCTGPCLLRHQPVPLTGFMPQCWTSSQPCLLKIRKQDKGLKPLLLCSLSKCPWEIPAKRPVKDLPCGCHLEVGTPGDLSTLRRVENRPWNADTIAVKVAYGVPQAEAFPPNPRSSLSCPLGSAVGRMHALRVYGVQRASFCVPGMQGAPYEADHLLCPNCTLLPRRK